MVGVLMDIDKIIRDAERHEKEKPHYTLFTTTIPTSKILLGDFLKISGTYKEKSEVVLGYHFDFAKGIVKSSFSSSTSMIVIGKSRNSVNNVLYNILTQIVGESTPIDTKLTVLAKDYDNVLLTSEYVERCHDGKYVSEVLDSIENIIESRIKFLNKEGYLNAESYIKAGNQLCKSYIILDSLNDLLRNMDYNVVIGIREKLISFLKRGRRAGVYFITTYIDSDLRFVAEDTLVQRFSVKLVTVPSYNLIIDVDIIHDFCKKSVYLPITNSNTEKELLLKYLKVKI